jgi:hypothetical protein
VPQESSLGISGGGEKYGDGDPTFSHWEGRTWTGGRAGDDFSVDPSRFYDSRSAFTMVESKIFPAPQWHIGTGIRTSHEYLPGNIGWEPVTGDRRYLASQFTVGGSNLSADTACVWLKRVGSPGDLTVEIWTDSSSLPGSIVASATNTISSSDFPDIISEFYSVDLSAASDLTASTAYWLVVYGDSGDSGTSHWEIGSTTATDNSKMSSAGSSWSSASLSIYYRVTDSDIKRSFRIFEMEGATYAVDIKDDASASSLYINGYRGIATAASSTTITDSAQAYTVDDLIGSYVKITKGTGKGQHAIILDNTATVITTATWNITPDTTSEFVVYAHESWTELSTTGLGAVLSVAVLNNIAYFAQGESDNIRRMQWTSGSPGHTYADDSTNKASLLYVSSGTAGGEMWRGNNGSAAITVSSADGAAWGVDLVFGSAIYIGDYSYDIINMVYYDSKILVLKADGAYSVSGTSVSKTNINLDFIKSNNNGQALLAHELFLFFSFADFSIQRYYGSDQSEVGYNKGLGLPSARNGRCAWMAGHPVGIFAAVDADDGTSSILFREDTFQSWHEVFRAPSAGHRIRFMHWQDNLGAKPRFWFEVNGELFYQEWAYRTFNPLEDSTFKYQHESVVVLSDIDAGRATRPKFIKGFSLFTENLDSGVSVACEYQVDNKIGSTEWTRVEDFRISPIDTLGINRGFVKRIRLRLRLLTNVATIPPIVKASVLEGYVKFLHKYQWVFQAEIGSSETTALGIPDTPPDTIIKTLQKWAESTTRLKLKYVLEHAHDKDVVVVSVVRMPQSYSPETKEMDAVIQVTVMEA